MRMPPYYRIEVVITDHGTGMGDECYGLVLQKLETRAVRTGIWPFVKTKRVTTWWAVETGPQSPSGSFSKEERKVLKKSAWARYHEETGGVYA